MEFDSPSIHTVCICLISSSKLTVPGWAAVTRSCRRRKSLDLFGLQRMQRKTRRPITYTIQQPANMCSANMVSTCIHRVRRDLNPNLPRLQAGVCSERFPDLKVLKLAMCNIKRGLNYRHETHGSDELDGCHDEISVSLCVLC
jgi:hypothetical protein